MRPIEVPIRTVIGTGLIALDLIVTSSGIVTHTVGGTCGNVLTLLSVHGINTRPIGKIGCDQAGDLVCAQMSHLGSDTSLVLRTSAIHTTRIVEIAPTDGAIRHRFTFTCPKCTRRLPRNSALKEGQAQQLAVDWSDVDLFFFDRATPAGVHLAKEARNSGVTVMFEPPKTRSRARLKTGISTADIVKYSYQDYKNGLPVELTSNLRLLIETRGKEGLRYRYMQTGELSDWRDMPAFDSVHPRDTAGAGDWCTAGFINEIVNWKGTERWTPFNIEAALKYGQALAAISVCFIGPLGALFSMSENEIRLAAGELQKKGFVPSWARMQREEDRAFGPAWPLELRPAGAFCNVCLLRVPASESSCHEDATCQGRCKRRRSDTENGDTGQ